LGRRHDARPKILQGAPPQIAILKQILIRFELVESDISLVRAVGMAIKAILLEDRADIPVKFRALRPVCSEAEEGKSQNTKLKRATERTSLNVPQWLVLRMPVSWHWQTGKGFPV
jgi:hypothetical protein